MAKKKAPKKTATKSSGFFKKVIIAFLMILLLSAAISGYLAYKSIYKPNVNTDKNGTTYLYIKTGSNFNDVLYQLAEKNIISNASSFTWLAERKNYKTNVKAGKYKIDANMSNNALINLLRSGNQEPVKLVFNEARTKADFIKIITSQIEVTEQELNNLLGDDNFLKTYGLNSKNVLTLFIPNTYEFYWNTNAADFIKRMEKEHDKFWKHERKNKAAKLNLSIAQVTILASIVQQESRFIGEQPTIAGVYLNRLKKGMLLQADPTVIYAVGDFAIQRVLNEHLTFDSPYNTYKYKGLPPGPICIPMQSTIDAVLNTLPHPYIYFCAKADFSGRHAFASNLNDHNRNAAAFRNALNKRKIFK